MTDCEQIQQWTRANWVELLRHCQVVDANPPQGHIASVLTDLYPYHGGRIESYLRWLTDCLSRHEILITQRDDFHQNNKVWASWIIVIQMAGQTNMSREELRRSVN